jgi:hypothetical protein
MDVLHPPKPPEKWGNLSTEVIAIIKESTVYQAWAINTWNECMYELSILIPRWRVSVERSKPSRVELT